MRNITTLIQPDCGPERADDEVGSWSLRGEGLHLGRNLGGKWGGMSVLNVTATFWNGPEREIMIFSRPGYGQGGVPNGTWHPATEDLVCPGNDTNNDRFTIDRFRRSTLLSLVETMA